MGEGKTEKVEILLVCFVKSIIYGTLNSLQQLRARGANVNSVKHGSSLEVSVKRVDGNISFASHKIAKRLSVKGSMIIIMCEKAS